MNQVALIAEPVKASLSIEFSVAGVPLTQGSKSGRIVGKGKNARVVLTELSDMKKASRKSGGLSRWRACIERKADSAIRGDLIGPVHLMDGPVVLECEFVMPRSPSHFTSKGALCKGAPVVPQKDLDKLIRAVGDALSKVVYRDDVQVVGFGESTKRFSRLRDGVGGVIVKVRQV